MKRLLLTSTGFNNRRFSKLFLEKINKEPADIKVIFIPTAVIDDDARFMLPYCYKDLTDIGILPENIFIYELRHLTSQGYTKSDFSQNFRLLSIEEMGEYDAIYFCGGDEAYLLSEINRTGFKENMKTAVEKGLFYIGTSAGAVMAAKNLPNNLEFLENQLYVHCGEGTPCGKLPSHQSIHLTDQQAIWIEGDNYEIIE